MVLVKGSLVKQATPGDIIMIQGLLLARRRTGKYENDLAFTTYLQATNLVREKKKYV